MVRPGAVHRSLLDAYALHDPVPQPPQIEVKILGGVTELEDDFDDPEFQSAMFKYQLRLAVQEFDLLAQAVEIIEPDPISTHPQYQDMMELGLDVSTKTGFLRYIALAEQHDMVMVMGEVQYLSTVTMRGILEAQRMFNVSKRGVPLEQHRNPTGTVQVSAVYHARAAAIHGHYNWTEFCNLSGPEQSAIVAQYDIENKLQWLDSQESNAKNRRSRRR